MRCDERDSCLHEDEPCSLERPCSVNVEVYNNDFFFIRDNPVEIEGWAANWRIHGNSFVNSHSWLSMDGMQGGPVYVFGNTGTFDSTPGGSCGETWRPYQKRREEGRVGKGGVSRDRCGGSQSIKKKNKKPWTKKSE